MAGAGLLSSVAVAITGWSLPWSLPWGALLWVLPSITAAGAVAGAQPALWAARQPLSASLAEE